MEQAGVVECGDPIDRLVARRGPLSVAGSFPAQVDRGGDGTFAGTVTVTGAGRRVSGIASTEADVYVTRSGVVVATPQAKDLIGAKVDLAPGASQAFAARGSVRQCSGDDSGGGEPLAAGRYEVYAVVVVNDDTGTGTAVVGVGGPWPLEVR